MTMTALFVTATNWKQPKCPWKGEWKAKNGIFFHIMEYY